MIIQYDRDPKSLVDKLIPRFDECRFSKLFLKYEDSQAIATEAVMLVGSPSLFCSVTAKTLTYPRIEYFPLVLKQVDPNSYPADGWITFGRAGGASELDRRLQWRFDRPILRLLESEEEVADGIGPHAKKDILRFYGGLELRDPVGRHVLQFKASDLPDFVLHLRLFDDDNS
ncbi:MAG TPA: hypothetical protein VKA03_06155 [Methylovirgula sp.]|nr:hypothetical protein [Methylovirgula sp.]